MKRLLITICGRAGSKGFKNKNLKNFCGKPLVYYSLSAAELFIKNHPELEVDIALNTDSEDLAKLVAAEYPEVIYLPRGAELGGDRPLVVTLIMVVATAVLFTTLSGLGSIIMVGSIVLPILISVGVPAASAACIFLMAFTTGLACNIANWKSFASIFSLDIADIQGFEIYLMAATAIR